jgi:hypothetical protein
MNQRRPAEHLAHSTAVGRDACARLADPPPVECLALRDSSIAWNIVRERRGLSLRLRAGRRPPPPGKTCHGVAGIRTSARSGRCRAQSSPPAGRLRWCRPPVVEARLEDLAWVGEQGMAHERVVLWFVDTPTSCPRACSACTGRGRAASRCAGRAATSDRCSCARSADRREWNLKVAYDADELARHGAEVSRSSAAG